MWIVYTNLFRLLLASPYSLLSPVQILMGDQKENPSQTFCLWWIFFVRHSQSAFHWIFLTSLWEVRLVLPFCFIQAAGLACNHAPACMSSPQAHGIAAGAFSAAWWHTRLRRITYSTSSNYIHAARDLGAMRARSREPRAKIFAKGEILLIYFTIAAPLTLSNIPSS